MVGGRGVRLRSEGNLKAPSPVKMCIRDRFLPTERTTPESYELQKLLREMADSGCTHVVMEVSSHSLVLDRVAGIKMCIRDR